MCTCIWIYAYLHVILLLPFCCSLCHWQTPMYVFIIFLFALCLIVQVKVTRYQNSLESDSATRTRTEQGFCIDYSPVDAKIAEKYWSSTLSKVEFVTPLLRSPDSQAWRCSDIFCFMFLVPSAPGKKWPILSASRVIAAVFLILFRDAECARIYDEGK